MRRNSVTLIKYIVVAGMLLALGPLALKLFFGKNKNADVDIVDANVAMPHGPRKADKEAIGILDPTKKIDWHDYKLIAEMEQRTGPGEQGTAVILSPEEEKKKEKLYRVNGFNAYVSDKISLHRALKDIRHPECKKKKYRAKLPTASIVVPFHNEHWTTLLRTAQSVLDQSPDHLIKEIILADDASTKAHCKQPLDDYVKKHYTKVKVVRAKKREGLIRTRLLGARAATGDVLIFLDSHCEANVNWLPPLLEPIAEDHKTAVCPFIDVIDFENFAYRAQDEGARGAFDWEFFYKRLPLLPEDLKHPADPFRSPVMAGGLFAIDREWFWELGGYDPGLDIWGGEQYELSFKIWQCHGRMVDAPCSRVGHIYRKFAPFPNPGIGDFVGKNYRRVAEVWMDEYAEYLYKRRPHYRNINTGDISAQKAIREKLKCKPFSWFMKEVAFDLPKRYPPIEPPPYASGEIRQISSNLCLDTKYRGSGDHITLEACTRDNPGAGGEQELELSWHKDIRPKKRSVCLDVSTSEHKAPVILFNCHGMQGNQLFKYNMAKKQIFHPISGQCLDGDAGSKEVYMTKCDDYKETQKWQLSNVQEKEMKKLWEGGLGPD